MKKKSVRWRRRLSWFGLVLCATFVGLVLTEQVLRALYPFPRHLIDELPQSACVFAADGTLLRVAATLQGERVLPVSLASISPHVRAALVCSEDERFFTHRGVDPLAALRAVVQNVAGGRVVSGASTITMQVVRILMPSRPRTFAFKLEQMFRARQLERILTKDQILQLYCNHVPLGGAVRGFEAAAQRWFGVSASALSTDQAAALVAMLPAPSRRSPRARPALLRRLRDRLLARMRDTGVLGRQGYLEAVHASLGARRRPWPHLAPHACDFFLGRSAGTVHRTTLDLRLQQRLESIAAATDTNTDAIAIVVLDRETARVRAMIGSPDYATTQLNTATCRRSVGSTLKPFLYGLALESGVVGFDARVDDTRARIGSYRPANFSRDYAGAMDVGEALATSRNLPAVRLLRAVGPERFADLLRRLGLPADPRGLMLDAALGTCTASPFELARAYCRFVAGVEHLGLRRRTVRRVLDALAVRRAGAMRGAIAVKTGTSAGRRDAWCVAVTHLCVAVVWVGNLSGAGEADLVGSQVATRWIARVVDAL